MPMRCGISTRRKGRCCLVWPGVTSEQMIAGWMWAKDVVPTCFSSPPASSPSSAAAASSSMLSQYVMGALPIPLEEEEDQSIS
eukprot:9488898-Pyramimonas_sp.AAC.1